MFSRLFQLHQKAKKIIIITSVITLFLGIIFSVVNSNEYSSTDQRYYKKSTLPYGTSVIYNSLQDILGKNNVQGFRRDFTFFPEKNIKNSTMFIIGLNNIDSEETINAAYEFAEKGANVIIAFDDSATKEISFINYSGDPFKDLEKENKEEKENKKEEEEEEDIKKERIENSIFSITDFANHALLDQDLPQLIKSKAKPTKFMPNNLAEDVVFLTHTYFTNIKNITPLYTLKRKPIVLMKKFNNKNNGRLMVFSSSYIFTNEAFTKKTNAKLLSFILQNRKNVYFYECHQGLNKSLNTMWLLRQYRLGFAAITLLIIAILLVWQNVWGIPENPNNEEIQKLNKDLQFTPPIKRLTASMISSSNILITIIQIVKKEARQLKLNKNETSQIAIILSKKSKGRPAQKYNNAVAFIAQQNEIYYNMDINKENKINEGDIENE